MIQYPKLSSTPIKEIIFTISYSETVGLNNLKKFSQHENIIGRFNSMHEGFKTKLSASEGKEPQASISNDGYILKCPDENKVIQAREGSISFHKTNEYEDFELLLEELLNYWHLLLDCADEKLSINNLSLRYLNFIDIDGEENIFDLITIKPTNPFVDNIVTYFMQLQFENIEHKDIKINLITTPNKTKEDKGIVLDIILNQKLSGITDYKVISGYFEVMREIKNEVFFKSITDLTVKKYIK